MGAELSVVLQVVYIVMQVVAEIWKSPVGDMFRDWYKSHQPQKKLQATEIFS